MKNNIKNFTGIITKHYKNGDKLSESYYENGERVRVKYFWPNEIVDIEYELVNGEVVGDACLFNKKGEIAAEFTYKNGKILI